MCDERSKCKLEDVMGIINTPKIEGRFEEILSTQKIKDTKTGIEYDGLVDTDLLILINSIVDDYEFVLQKIILWDEIKTVKDKGFVDIKVRVSSDEYDRIKGMLLE